MQRILIALALVVVTACAGKAPPNIAPADVGIWQADQAQVVLGTLQHVAIGLNAINKCNTAAPPVCVPLLDDENTGIVVDAVTDAIIVIQATPDGWRAALSAGLARLDARLDAAGKSDLKGYLDAARAYLAQ